MELRKNSIISILYIALSYLLYLFLLERFDYPVKYLMNLLFMIYIFVKFVFGQIEFYAERFRLKEVFSIRLQKC